MCEFVFTKRISLPCDAAASFDIPVIALMLALRDVFGRKEKCKGIVALIKMIMMWSVCTFTRL